MYYLQNIKMLYKDKDDNPMFYDSRTIIYSYLFKGNQSIFKSFPLIDFHSDSNYPAMLRNSEMTFSKSPKVRFLSPRDFKL